MGDLLGSFHGCRRVKPKCVEKASVGLWGQSTVSMSNHWWSVGPGCYKWYLRKPATVTDCVFSAPSGGKDSETTGSIEDVVFLSGVSVITQI